MTSGHAAGYQAEHEACDGCGDALCGDADCARNREDESAEHGAGKGENMRPDQTSIHSYGSIGKLALRLRTDFGLTIDRAASVAATMTHAVRLDEPTRVCWLACVLPLPTHADRVKEAQALLADCGFVSGAEVLR